MLSEMLKELRALFILHRPAEPMEPETYEFIASSLQISSEIAEQLERLARSKAQELEPQHLDDPKIMPFPVISRDPKSDLKGTENDT